MKTLFVKLFLLVIILYSSLLIQATLTLADNLGLDDAGKFYIQYNILNNSIGNDFDGLHSYSPDGKINYYTPKLTDGTGLGFAIGEIRSRFVGEVYGTISQHQGTYTKHTDFTCIYEEGGLHFKYLILDPKSIFNIYGLIGAGYMQVIVQNGAINKTTTSQVDDACFSGFNYNMGICTTLKLNQNFTIEGSYIQKQFTINQVKGLGITQTLDKFTALGKTYCVNLVYLY